MVCILFGGGFVWLLGGLLWVFLVDFFCCFFGVGFFVLFCFNRGLILLLSCPFTPKVSSSKHHSRCVLAHPQLQGLIRYSLCLKETIISYPVITICRSVWLQACLTALFLQSWPNELKRFQCCYLWSWKESFIFMITAAFWKTWRKLWLN